MNTEDILKSLLRGESQLSKEVVESAAKVGPALVALIKNVRLWHTEPAGMWAVLHSIRLVSELRLQEATPALVDAIFLAFSTRHEEALEDLPVALAKAGPGVVRQLSSIVEDQTLDGTIRSVAASALEGIAVLHPETRDEMLSTMRKIVAAPEESTSLRGHVISIVAHFRVPEDARLIKTNMPLMSDMETDDVDEYFARGEDPDAWAAFRASLLEYYD